MEKKHNMCEATIHFSLSLVFEDLFVPWKSSPFSDGV